MKGGSSSARVGTRPACMEPAPVTSTGAEHCEETGPRQQPQQQQQPQHGSGVLTPTAVTALAGRTTVARTQRVSDNTTSAPHVHVRDPPQGTPSPSARPIPFTGPSDPCASPARQRVARAAGTKLSATPSSAVVAAAPTSPHLSSQERECEVPIVPESASRSTAGVPAHSDNDKNNKKNKKKAKMQNFDRVSRPAYSRKKKLPVKTAIAAVLMFAFGTIFLLMGVRTLSDDKERAIAMIVIGSLTFIPGSYASYNLYGAYKQWPGFRYDYVPSYDD